MDLGSGGPAAAGGAGAPGGANLIKDSSTSGFASDVIEASKSALVLVDFWASWCGPCRTLGPILEKVVKAYGGKVRLVKIDTDEHQAIGWFRPEETAGLPMLPPTAAVLAELATFATVEQALAPRREPVPIMPRPIPVDEQEQGIDWVLVNGYTGQPL